ncbi:MAG TPA: hypothetical protein VGV64_00800, partial [Thermoplasmata archaeon]|nr:hypothetical protein [Thermoplasmata archaeon]
MQRLTDLCDPAEIEASVRSFWIERTLQATPGTVGPVTGPGARQFLGSLSAVEPPLDLLARAVFGDAQARYAALRGQRSSGVSIVRSGSADPWVNERRALLDQMGCWTSVGPVRTLEEPGGPERLQSIVDQLARTGLIVTRNLPLRYCPRCRSPRSPETIVYQAQRAPAYLVRFPIRDSNPPVSLLVWVDAPWKLLGTSAVLVNPDLRYVRAIYRRRGVEEQIVVTESALDRLKRWLPNCELEVLASQTGRELGGTRYLHPVATEFPAIADLPAPAGTVIPSSDVGDSGTGLVALVPSHGAADAAAAATLHVTGPTVLQADGKLRAEDRHKYTRLPIDAADSFILRDLTEGGLVFAQLTVRRGVPYCSICGRGLLWLPGRAWCL